MAVEFGIGFSSAFARGSNKKEWWEDVEYQLPPQEPQPRRRRQSKVWPDFSPWAARELPLPPDEVEGGDEVVAEAPAEAPAEEIIRGPYPPVVGDVSPRAQRLLRQIRSLEREIAATRGIEARRDEEDFLMMLFLSA